MTTLRCQDLTLQDQILEKYRVLTKAQTLHTFFSQRLSYHPIIKKLISRLSDVRTTVKKLLDLVNPNGSLSLSIIMFAGLYFFKMETDLMSQY